MSRASAVLHPLIKTLAAQPDLLVEHAGAYLQLAGVEAQELGQGLQRRAVLLATAALAALVGSLLAGVALLLWAVTPPAALQQPWLLIAVPALPLLLAAGAALRLRHQAALPAFALLREQLQADRQLLTSTQ